MASILDIFKHVQQQGDLGRANYERRETGSALGRLLAGGDRKTELANVAKYNPEAAVKFQGLMSNMDEGRLKRLGQQAAMFATAPAAVRQQMYPSMAQDANALGFPVPSEYNPGLDDMIIQFGQTFAGQAGQPAGYQEFDLLARDADLTPEDRAIAARRALYLDRRPSNAALKYEGIEGDDGRTRTYALDPNNPNATQIGGGASYAPTGGDQTAIIEQEIGRPLTQQERQQIASGTFNLRIPATTGGVNPFVSRRPEDEAAAKAAAERSVLLDTLPQELQLRTGAAIQQAEGSAQAQADVKRGEGQRERMRSFEQFDQAMRGVESALAGTVTNPATGLMPPITADQQIAEGSVAAMAPILKQLFRAAGEGVFTDKDQELLMKMMPTRSDHPEARKAKIANIRAIVQAKLGADGGRVAGDVSGLSDDELLRALGQ